MFSHGEATHQSNSFSTILDRIFKARNASRYGKISGSSLTFLPSKRCIAAWILSSKNCSISGYALLLSMPFAITTPKQALGSSSKISFNKSHFMPFLSALDRNTYFSHKFFTVISNAIVYERDFSRKTNNLYLFFCDVVKELFIVRWSFYMTASKTQPYTKCFGKSNGFTCINVLLIQY